MIILIKADTELGKNTNPPLGLMYVGGALRKAGYDVEIVHCIPSEFNATVERVARKQPLYVGFSVITGLPAYYSAQLSKQIKKRSDTTVVWGGIHPTLCDTQCASEDYIDIVVRGEGEVTSVELAKALEKKLPLERVAGITYKKDGKIFVNKDRPLIKDMDFYRLDFELVDMKSYLRKTENYTRAVSYITSRGCPHSCRFCYNQKFNKCKWRATSSDVAIEDVNYLKENFDIDAIYFWDDNFFVNMKRAFTILENIGIPAYSEIRIDYITKDVAKKLKETRCKMLLIGPESGSNRILDVMNKNFHVEDTVRAVKLLAEYRIPTNYSFIIGVPGEKKYETLKTIDLAFKIHELHNESYFTINQYMPFPGTEFYDIAVSDGFRPPSRTEDWADIDSFGDKINLPWIDAGFCYKIRWYFFHLQCGIKPVEKWFKFRLKHKMYAFPVDLMLYQYMYESKFWDREKIKKILLFGKLFEKYILKHNSAKS